MKPSHPRARLRFRAFGADFAGDADAQVAFFDLDFRQVGAGQKTRDLPHQAGVHARGRGALRRRLGGASDRLLGHVSQL